MGIETVQGVDNILKNHDASSWIKQGGIENPTLDKAFSIPSIDNRKSFADLLMDSMTEVNDLQQNADQAIQRLVTGRSKNIHETMLAVEKAEIAFKTMNQIRLKVIDAYREIMRMQV